MPASPMAVTPTGESKHTFKSEQKMFHAHASVFQLKCEERTTTLHIN